jgi:hypothetical protein
MEFESTISGLVIQLIQGQRLLNNFIKPHTKSRPQE